MSTLTITPGARLQGEVYVPGDKSISHRAVIIGALAEGATVIRGFLAAEDTLHTAGALKQMGVAIEGLGTPDMLVRGAGLRGLFAPGTPLDLGNSGTGMRLLLGALAGQAFSATLFGDESLSRRPMDRIAAPLGLMGVRVEGRGEHCTPPVTVRGGTPAAITYRSPVASAQVKSAVLLAGLFAEGVTAVIEPALSRDHTERMLSAFGAQVETGASPEGPRAAVTGPARLRATEVEVPGDFSSGAYFLAAALLCPNSDVTVRGVILNPTRAALLNVLGRMGGQVAVVGERQQAGERVGDVRSRFGAIQGTLVAGPEIPSLIDEIPLLAVVATQAAGTTEIRDASELRVKESDRIAVMGDGLRRMGAKVQELPDGMVIEGPTPLRGTEVDALHDHRIAMSFAVAGLIADGPTTISGAESIPTSFPGFAEVLRGLGASVEAG